MLKKEKNMPDICYYNGKTQRCEELAIPLSDRSIYFADSVYEVAIGMGGNVYQLGEHLTRFYNNISTIGLSHPLIKAEAIGIIFDLVKKAKLNCYMLYLQCSGNGEKRRHARSTDKSNILISLSAIELSPTLTSSSLISLPDIRYSICNIKTTNLLPAVLASTIAENEGCREAVFYRDGIVTECAHSNIFILKGDTLYTHPNGPHILPGITRSNIIKNAPALGLKVSETRFGLEDIYTADEVLTSATTSLITRVTSLDKKPVGCKNEACIRNIYQNLYADFTKQCGTST